MITHPFVDEYIDQWKNGEIILNQDRIDLINYLENVVLVMDVYFDEKQIDDFVRFSEKWFFDLQPFQKFLICFVILS